MTRNRRPGRPVGEEHCPIAEGLTTHCSSSQSASAQFKSKDALEPQGPSDLRAHPLPISGTPQNGATHSVQALLRIWCSISVPSAPLSGEPWGGGPEKSELHRFVHTSATNPVTTSAAVVSDRSSAAPCPA